MGQESFTVVDRFGYNWGAPDGVFILDPQENEFFEDVFTIVQKRLEEIGEVNFTYLFQFDQKEGRKVVVLGPYGLRAGGMNQSRVRVLAVGVGQLATGHMMGQGNCSTTNQLIAAGVQGAGFSNLLAGAFKSKIDDKMLYNESVIGFLSGYVGSGIGIICSRYTNVVQLIDAIKALFSHTTGTHTRAVLENDPNLVREGFTWEALVKAVGTGMVFSATLRRLETLIPQLFEQIRARFAPTNP